MSEPTYGQIADVMARRFVDGFLSESQVSFEIEHALRTAYAAGQRQIASLYVIPGERLVDKIEALINGRAEPDMWAWALVDSTALDEAKGAVEGWRRARESITLRIGMAP
jgi:hypothetical protein